MRKLARTEEIDTPMSNQPVFTRADVEPTAVERNVELTGEKDPYRLDYSNNPNLPIVGIDCISGVPALALPKIRSSVDRNGSPTSAAPAA